MNDYTSDPNTEQVTVWRNLLDAFAQLSAAWQAAESVQQAASSGTGPAATGMPDSLVLSFTRAGEETADALTGLATVLAQQDAARQRFTDTAEAQRGARDQWRESHTALRGEGEAER